MVRRILIVANPIAGVGRAREATSRLCDALRARGLVPEVFWTDAPGDAGEIARRATPYDVAAVTVVGGDGTLNEVVGGLAEPGVPVAVCPVGTTNTLAHGLGLPTAPEQVAELVAGGTTRSLPITVANRRRFLAVLGAGLDGAMVERLSATRRRRLGRMRMLLPVLHVVRHWPRAALSVETDAGDRRSGLTEVVVTSLPSYGGVLHLPAPPGPDDARLRVLCFRQRTRRAWLALLWRSFRDRLRDGRDVETLRAASLRIASDVPAPYHVDGDYGGTTPVDVRRADDVVELFVDVQDAV